MKGGYFKKYLWVNLSTRKIEEETVSDDLYAEYLGGYGLGARVLFERQKPGLSKFDPGNILGFVTGPLTGTPAITGNRLTIVGKSPLTDTWGDSNCGGYFAPALKMSGYDAVFFTGKSEEPVYFWLENNRGVIRSARDLWGKDAAKTEQLLKEDHGKGVQVLSIGEPGERKNLIAAIMHDGGRAAGRSGLGALMGSKNLKAFAVRGTLHVPVFDENETRKIRSYYLSKYKDNPQIKHFRKYGTIDHVASSTFINDAPVKNWTGVGLTEFPEAEKISDDAILYYEQKKYGCWQCPLVCGSYVAVEDGPYKITNVHKPEYETIAMFGSNLLNDNLESIILVNELCNRHGIDTISTGAAVAFAIECYAKGILTEEDTDGLELNWGNHNAIVDLVKLIVKNEGIGSLLANGAKYAADKIGRSTEEFVIHVKGQDIPAHDPRYGPSWGTYYQADATPGRHTQIGLVMYEIGNGFPGLKLDQKIAKYNPEGKGCYAARVHNIQHAVYCTGVCLFAMQRTDINAWLDFTNSICGTAYTLDDFENIGARIATIRQAFNVREGLDAASFRLSERAWANPLPGGPLEGVTIDLPKMVADYYTAQGWDERGIPKPETLNDLGLSWLSN